MRITLEELFDVWKKDPEFQKAYQEILYEEALEIAEMEDGYRKLPKYKQEERVQQIMKDLKEDEKFKTNSETTWFIKPENKSKLTYFNRKTGFIIDSEGNDTDKHFIDIAQEIFSEDDKEKSRE